MLCKSLDVIKMSFAFLAHTTRELVSFKMALFENFLVHFPHFTSIVLSCADLTC